MKIAFVSSEIYPFAKTGGLADVAGALPKEIAALSNDVILFMPKYSALKINPNRMQLIREFENSRFKLGEREYTFSVYVGKLPKAKLPVYFIDCPQFFDRENIYTNDSDEHLRFAFFSKAVIETLQRLKWSPDIVHINDWQSSLISYYLKHHYSWDKLFAKTKTLLTIHNIGYQGTFSPKILNEIDVDSNLFYSGGPAELYGNVNYLKLGILYSDKINTVSETYSDEILTKEFGSALEGVLSERKSDLLGILNGIDVTIWNPDIDRTIPANYNFATIRNKVENKKILCEKMGINFNPKIPIIGIVSRLAIQKGFDIIIEALPELLKLKAQWIVLGNGEKEYEKQLKSFSKKYPEKFAVKIGYNNKLAHLIEAGADIFLMPSKYEPCGLNQMYSLNYGTVPIVRKTGGLADTVIDFNTTQDEPQGNGFVFEKYSSDELLSSVIRALNFFHKKRIWKSIQMRGMKDDFSWFASAKKYFELYKLLTNTENVE